MYFAKMKNITSIAASAVFLAMSNISQSALITPGFTFSSASDCVGGVGSAITGSHFHSSTGGDFGNPAGLAEVGEFGGDDCEEVRGLSEYDLAGLVTGPAFVTFTVFQAGGLFPGSNDFPWDGTIEIDAYTGNNLEDVSDFEAASTGIVSSFTTTGLFVGNTLSFNITSIFDAAIGNGDAALGIRLAAITDPEAGAWGFNDFRLTSTDMTTNVPVPATLVLLAMGFGVMLIRRRRY